MLRLKELREKQGLSLRQLAIEAGLHFVSLARLEAGRFDPRLSTLHKLSKALKTNIPELTRGPTDHLANAKQKEADMQKQANARKKWNDTVEQKIKIMTPLKAWLRDYAKEERKNAWDEQLSIERAMHYLELASLEIYNLQYHRSDEEKERSARALDLE